MAECSVQLAEQKPALREFSSELSNGSSSLFHRRIDFHPARRPYKGFGSNGGGDFRIETLNPSVSSEPVRTGFGSGQPKKSDGSEVSDGGLDPELSFGITFRTIGAGLENMGNTCYLNSVLQCLTYTEPLAAYLQSGKHKNTCRIAGFCALCAIQKHVSRALQSTGRCLSPNDLVANLKCISRNFRSWRQEDAHEYMVNLLESMHRCCLPSGVPSESPSAYEKSLVHKIFGGSLRSQVKCLQCSFCSNKFDPFLDLSLEINKADSVDKALSHFTAAELLDGGEREYQCQRCKQKVKARKQLTVHKPPYVLTIHLKRFRAHDPGQKIDKKVNFGSTLDLRPFLSDSQGDAKYTLYGVLVHSGGSTRSGHYFCFVRTSSGIWHSLDDNRVSPVSERSVLEQKAYMLFYVRDRKNIVPRKASEMALRDNIKTNEKGTNASSALIQVLKKPVQNEVRSNGVASAAAVVQKGMSSAIPSGIPISNERLNQPKSEQSIMSSQLKDPSEILPPPKTPGQSLKPTEPPQSINGVAVNFETGGATNATNTNGLNEKGSSDKNSSVSVVGSAKVEEIQSFESAKIVINRSSMEINPASHVKDSSTDSSKEATIGSSVKVDQVKQLDQPSHEQSQIGTMTNGSSATDNPLDTKTTSNGQNLVHGKSFTLPGSSTITSDSIPVDASDCKSSKKLKKKILRRQVANLNLGKSFLIRASLAVRKRKKFQRSKCRRLGQKNLTKEPSDNGPSTSEKTHIVSMTAIHHQRKEAKSSSKVEANGTAPKENINSSSESLKHAVNGESREQIGQSCTVHSGDKQLQEVPSITVPVKQLNGGESGSTQDRKRDRMGNGWMGMLSRGLEDSVVARWDDVDLPNEHLESCAAESVTIGYVPDEWDEEYDRGKRKKVKQAKLEFGGENPFQQIASNKIMLKKAKIERARSGNQPFRI